MQILTAHAINVATPCYVMHERARKGKKVGHDPEKRIPGGYFLGLSKIERQKYPGFEDKSAKEVHQIKDFKNFSRIRHPKDVWNGSAKGAEFFGRFRLPASLNQ